MRLIRESTRSNVALAGELGISDVLVSKVRRGLLWAGEPGPRNRDDIARHASRCAISELCGLTGRDVDLAVGRMLSGRLTRPRRPGGLVG